MEQSHNVELQAFWEAKEPSAVDLEHLSIRLVDLTCTGEGTWGWAAITCLQEQNRSSYQAGDYLMIWLVVICPNRYPGQFPIGLLPRQETDCLCLSGYGATSRNIWNTDSAPEKQAQGLPNCCLPQRDPWLAVEALYPTPLQPPLLHTEHLQEGSETLPDSCEGSAATTSSRPRSFWFSVPRCSSLLLAFPTLYAHPSYGQLILTKLFPVWCQ